MNHPSIKIFLSKYVDKDFWRSRSSEFLNLNFSFFLRVTSVDWNESLKRTICWIFRDKVIYQISELYFQNNWSLFDSTLIVNIPKYLKLFKSSSRYPASHRISQTSETRMPSSFSYFLDIPIKSCHFVSRWSQECRIRKYWFQREDEISRSNRNNPLTNSLQEI